MPDTPILQISRLEEVFQEDTAGIAELLEAAMHTGAGHQETLRRSIEDESLDDVVRAAHAIKGSSANIGGNEVAAVAAGIESSARAGTWDGIPAAATELDRAYERLRVAVRDYRAGIE